jgi:putative membrane protein
LDIMGKNFTRAALACALAATPAIAVAQPSYHPPITRHETTIPSQNLTEGLSRRDLHVLAFVHEANQQEIEAGRLAMQRGTTRDVRRYGRMLVEDHRSNDRMALGFVEQMGQTIPEFRPRTEAERMDMRESEQAIANLRELQGPQFDREFLRAMIAAHDQTITNLREEMAQVQSPELAQMLRGEMPRLYQHRAMARRLLGEGYGPR